MILAFYSADWSPVCGDQMALYNEILPEFRKYGAEAPMLWGTSAILSTEPNNGTFPRAVWRLGCWREEERGWAAGCYVLYWPESSASGLIPDGRESRTLLGSRNLQDCDSPPRPPTARRWPTLRPGPWTRLPMVVERPRPRRRRDLVGTFGMCRKLQASTLRVASAPQDAPFHFRLWNPAQRTIKFSFSEPGKPASAFRKR